MSKANRLILLAVFLLEKKIPLSLPVRLNDSLLNKLLFGRRTHLLINCLVLMIYHSLCSV